MKAKKSSFSVSGLKCDNPNCDYRDDSIQYEEYPKYIGYPCPKCGAVLLTKEDYKLCKTLERIAKVTDFLHLTGPTLDDANASKIHIGFNGTGTISDITIEEKK